MATPHRFSRARQRMTAALFLLAAYPASGIDYTFIKVADSQGGYFDFKDATIDRVGGGVVFRASREFPPGVFQHGVFTWNAGVVTSVATGGGFVTWADRPSMITVGPGHVVYFFGATQTAGAEPGVWQRDDTASPAIAELWPADLCSGPHPNAFGSAVFRQCGSSLSSPIFPGIRVHLGSAPVVVQFPGLDDYTISDSDAVAATSTSLLGGLLY
jgi:hypothetical protein